MVVLERREICDRKVALCQPVRRRGQPRNRAADLPPYGQVRSPSATTLAMPPMAITKKCCIADTEPAPLVPAPICATVQAASRIAFHFGSSTPRIDRIQHARHKPRLRAKMASDDKVKPRAWKSANPCEKFRQRVPAGPLNIAHQPFGDPDLLPCPRKFRSACAASSVSAVSFDSQELL